MPRKLVLKMEVSVDGFVGRLDGEVESWVMATMDDELKAYEVDLLWQAGTHVMGRGAYEDMSPHWPTSDEPYAPPMNEIPKVVFSTSLTDPEWQATTVAGGDLREEVERLKSDDDKPILAHGGARLAQALSARGLIDEYRLIVRPLALGEGLPLFAEPAELRLLEARSFPGGAVLHVYEPAR